MPDLAVLLVVVVTAIAAHELAHAVAARAIGHDVFEIEIGARPHWCFTVAGVPVRVGLLPLGGHVQTGAPDPSGFRWRSAVVASSGVAANVGLAAVGALAGVAPMVAFNLLAAGANLWPGRRRQLGSGTSDGRLLWDLLRHDADALAEERSGWFSMQAMRARDAGRLDDAAALVEEGIDTVGQTRALLAVAGVVAFEQRRFADVVEAYAPLIDDSRVTVSGRAGFAADAAWAACLSGDIELRRLAAPWAAFARRVDPRSTRRRVVYALALVDADDPAAGLGEVDHVDDPAAQAVAVLALAALGDHATARDRFGVRVSERLDPDHPLLGRVRDALDHGS